jgi:hypothetical protein
VIVFDDENIEIINGSRILLGSYGGTYTVIDRNEQTGSTIFNISTRVWEKQSLNIFSIEGILRRKIIIVNNKVVENSLEKSELYINGGGGEYKGCYGNWIPRQLNHGEASPKIQATVELRIPYW